MPFDETFAGRPHTRDGGTPLLALGIVDDAGQQLPDRDQMAHDPLHVGPFIGLSEGQAHPRLEALRGLFGRVRPPRPEIDLVGFLDERQEVSRGRNRQGALAVEEAEVQQHHGVVHVALKLGGGGRQLRREPGLLGPLSHLPAGRPFLLPRTFRSTVSTVHLRDRTRLALAGRDRSQHPKGVRGVGPEEGVVGPLIRFKRAAQGEEPEEVAVAIWSRGDRVRGGLGRCRPHRRRARGALCHGRRRRPSRLRLGRRLDRSPHQLHRRQRQHAPDDERELCRPALPLFDHPRSNLSPVFSDFRLKRLDLCRLPTFGCCGKLFLLMEVHIQRVANGNRGLVLVMDEPLIACTRRLDEYLLMPLRLLWELVPR